MSETFSSKLIVFFHKRTRFQIIMMILAVLIAGFAVIRISVGSQIVYEFVSAERLKIIQEVSITGHVRPIRSVELAFDKAGKVSRIFADVGDHIESGSIVVSLDAAELSADLDQAEANVKIAEANLAAAIRGSRPEEIVLEEAKLQSAETNFEEARKALIDSLDSSYATIYDTAKNKIDFLFAAQEGSAPSFRLNFSDGDTTLRSTAETERNELNNDLIAWRSSLNGINDSSDLQACSVEAKEVLRLTTRLITNLSNLLNTFTPGTYPSKTTVDSYRACLSAGQTAVNTALASFGAADAAFSAALADQTIASRNLALQQAGSTSEEISVEEAKLDQAEASVQKIKTLISKSNLYSPITGVITKQDTKVGEFVSTGQGVVFVISDAEFEIESDIPEADIAKVKLNDTANVTLDAYGNDVVFDAKVTKIDPGEIIIDGVPTYKTVFQFLQKDDRIKSGMTANIDILTASKEDALVVPQKAVITKNGRKIVRILTGRDNIEEIQVITGVRGSDGNIEILEGVRENDRVIISGKK